MQSAARGAKNKAASPGTKERLSKTSVVGWSRSGPDPFPESTGKGYLAVYDLPEKASVNVLVDFAESPTKKRLREDFDAAWAYTTKLKKDGVYSRLTADSRPVQIKWRTVKPWRRTYQTELEGKAYDCQLIVTSCPDGVMKIRTAVLKGPTSAATKVAVESVISEIRTAIDED